MLHGDFGDIYHIFCLSLHASQIDFRWAREIVIKFQCAFQIVKNLNFIGRNDNIMQIRALFGTIKLT